VAVTLSVDLKQQLRTAAARLGGQHGRDLYRRIRSMPAPPPEILRVAKGSWPQYPPPGYLGQLSDAFQSQLALERADLLRSDCVFYHASDFSDGTSIDGPWDLRGRESEYLGGISLKGKRVLELGPASGHMTFHMEKEGATVICLDAGFDVGNDLLPYGGIDVSRPQLEYMAHIGQVQNAWWYLHRDKRSKAKIVYGSIYDFPRDIGEFDVATFSAILLHLRSPFSALEQAARRTTGAIVVSEALDPAITDADGMRFHPTGSKGISEVWWSFSPRAIETMLDALGFHDCQTTFHSQRHYWGHDMTKPAQEVPMFTVVGRK
jgi:SAM-dependent methyltransferase